MLDFKTKLVGKGREREKVKIIGPFRSFTARNKKFQKNSKKIQKVKKHHYGLFSSQKMLENTKKERTAIEQQKNSKIPLWHHFKPK